MNPGYFKNNEERQNKKISKKQKLPAGGVNSKFFIKSILTDKYKKDQNREKQNIIPPDFVSPSVNPISNTFAIPVRPYVTSKNKFT